MWVNASMMVVSAAAICRCSLKVIEQDLEKKKKVCWRENRLSKRCLQVIYKMFWPESMSYSAYFECPIQEFACGKPGLGNSLLKSLEMATFPGSHVANVCWGYDYTLWHCLQRQWPVENRKDICAFCSLLKIAIFQTQLNLKTSQKVTYIQHQALGIDSE